ncbi:MAG: hypothetical protein IPK27_11780 [Rhodanobacteraceae bacterium]|nr:hypothetical protein [Rhodanobacteraceae bacterium]
MSHSDARIALACLDLDACSEDDTPATAATLARRAHTPHGTPAAIVVHPELLLATRMSLMREGIAQVRTAALVNVPEGEDPARAESEARRALAVGADEIELSFPHRAFARGGDAARELLAAVKARCGTRTLKVMLRGDALADDATLRAAADAAIAAGADYLHAAGMPTSARLRVLVEAIAAAGRPLGLKVSGVQTPAQASAVIALASGLYGRERVVPARLRIGGDRLLDALLPLLAAEPPDAD